MGRVPFIDAVLPQWRSWFFRSADAAHLRLGRQGERLAVRHLARNGYKILRRNVRLARGGEIDIVCRHRPTNSLVFVEVKTRSDEEFGRPSAAVDRDKRMRIIKGAMAWLRLLDMPEITFRFDVVEVVGDDVRIIENAFNLPGNYIY